MSCANRFKIFSNGLSARLTRNYAMLFFTSLLALSLCVFFASYHFLVEKQQRAIVANASILEDLVIDEINGHKGADKGNLLDELNTNTDMTLIVYDEDGNIFSMASNFPVITGEIPECMNKTVLYSQSDEQMLLCNAIPLKGMGSLTIVMRLNSEYAFLEMLARLLVLTNMIGVAVALAVGSAMTRRMLVPVGSMIDKAQQIDSKSLCERLDVPDADDELRHLALTVNGMLDRVEEAFVRQGQFTQDASHELRTPLAVLQGNADLLARWGKDDPAVRDKCIATMQRQIGYMENLVNDLLFLARGDSDRQIVAPEDIDLNMLFAEMLDERRAIDPHHVYESRMTNAGTIYADPTLLQQLLFILLDNAAKHTPVGGRIALYASGDTGGTAISVSDEGCGVAPEHIEHIFERFYRVDKARARSTGGLGLGLSIAKMIVQLHGGNIKATCAQGCGLTVTAAFPAKV